jgi:fibronectin type 3 domain-containing protein
VNSPISSRMRSLVLFGFLAAAVAGCEQVDVTAVPISRVEVTPPSAVVGVGRTVKLTAQVLSDQDEPLSGRTIVWESDDEDIAEVDGAGQVTGRSEGTVSIRARSEGVVGTASVQVTSAPAIAAAPSSVQFSAVQGGASPGDRTVTVTNAGQGSLSGLGVTVRYASGQPSGWLTATLSGSSAPATLVLSASGSGLASGSYTASVDITSGSAANSPLTVPVTFTVTAPAPAIGVSSASVSFAATRGGSAPASQTVAVTNLGGGTLSGLSTSVTYGSGQPGGWLTASLSGTTAPATLTLSAAPGSLAAGTYTATVLIASGVAQNSPQPVAVTFTISAATAPAIALSRSSVSFSTGALGGSPPSQTVEVTNDGGGTLSGLVVTVVGENTSWLSAELSRTTAPATITLNATRGLLPVGTYTATLRVTSGVASNSPVEIPVTFTVALGAPQTPGSLSATAVSDRRVDLAWMDRSDNEATFEIQRRSSGQDWAGIGGTGVNETSFADTQGLSGSREYEYRVRACNAVGCSDWSGTAKATTAPVPPGSVSASPTSSSGITVSWKDNSSDETGFRVERSSNGGQSWTLVTTTSANAESFSDSGLQSSTTYHYRVAACRGTLCSVFSDLAQATTPSGSTSTPTNLTATALSSTEVLLKWTAPGGQTKYEVRRRTGTSGGWTNIADVPGDTPEYTDKGLSPGSTYQYQVRACAGSSCSEYSSQATVTTPSG